MHDVSQGDLGPVRERVIKVLCHHRLSATVNFNRFEVDCIGRAIRVDYVFSSTSTRKIHRFPVKNIVFTT